MRRTARHLVERLARLLEAGRGVPALLCLGAALAAASAVLADRIAGGRAFDASLASLLPAELAPQLSDDLEAALRAKLSGDEAANVIVLAEVTAEDGRKVPAAVTAAAARAVRETLEADPALAERTSANAGGIPKPAHAAGNLLTARDRAELARLVALPEPERGRQLARRAAACLTNPASPKVLGFAADPFCAYDRHLTESLARLPWRTAMEEGRVRMTLRDLPAGRSAEAFVFTGDGRLAAAGEAHFAQALGRARAAAQAAADRAIEAADPGRRVTVRTPAAGVPLFTDAIASRAQRELTLIGTVSTAGVVLFAWALFGSPAALAMTLLTVASGFLISLGAAFAVFGTLSLITFVFGATLIGVSVDYSAHWFALKRPGESAEARRRRMLAPLLSAALSTAAAYGVLALTPLPGLRQMALVAAAGVLGTLLTVLTLLPKLERFAPARDTRLMRVLTERLPKLPRLTAGELRRPAVALTLLVVLAGGVFGISRLELTAGIRDLQGAPAALLADQAEVSRLMRLPSPAQAFVVEGRDLSAALRTEARLLERLAAAPELSGVTPSGLSRILPDNDRQDADRALYARAVEAASPLLAAQLGAAPQTPEGRLTLADLEATPWGELAGRHVLKNDADGAALLVLLAGVRPADLAALDRVARDLPGAQFVDITSGMSAGLALYRDRILEALGAGVLLLWAALTLRFGRDAWRAVLPSACGIAAALAVFGLAGVPATIFTALGLVLLLGLGVDYGIFLTGSPDDGRTSAAVLFSGATTLLSFGLLVLSSTPALQAFGLTVLVGQTTVWIVTPLVRPRR